MIEDIVAWTGVVGVIDAMSVGDRAAAAIGVALVFIWLMVKVTDV